MSCLYVLTAESWKYACFERSTVQDWLGGCVKLVETVCAYVCLCVWCRIQCSSCCSASPQLVCVPHDWRVTLAIIVIVNAAVSFMLEVRDISSYTSPWLIPFFITKLWFACIDFFPRSSPRNEWNLNDLSFCELFLSLSLWVSVADQLILKIALKSPVDFDPWHHLVEACFQRQSGGKSPHRGRLCRHTSGWEALHFTRFLFVSVSSDFLEISDAYSELLTLLFLWLHCFIFPFDDLFHVVPACYVNNQSKLNLIEH